MKKTTFLVLSLANLIITASASAQYGYYDVYCAPYRDGYSLYRVYDRKDIGNAYFRDFNHCREAADLANRVSQNVACSPYVNSQTNYQGYSAYRISDGQDLGHGIFSAFQSCQQAVSQTRNGILCLIYEGGAVTRYSPYDVYTGQDLGTTAYSSIEACQRAY